MQKSPKKRKPKVVYYPAPSKSRAAYFFASFFLTLTVVASAVGFAFADSNSQRLGWGRDIEVFAVIDSGSDVGFSVMGSSFTVSTADIDSAKAFAEKLIQSRVYLLPEPVQFAEIAGNKLYTLEIHLLSYFSSYL